MPQNSNLPSAGFSVTLEVRIENKPGRFLGLMQRFASLGCSLANLSLLYSDYNHLIRSITINCPSEELAKECVAATSEVEGVELLHWQDDTIEIHRGGKLSIEMRSGLDTTDELSRAYSPGVARISTMIAQDKSLAYDFTIKGSTIAVVSDGSAVLGLGNIGPEAAMPVMEGKAALFKRFAGLNAVPICLATQDVDEIVDTVVRLAPGFGGINLEDISAPRCFEIEDRLKQLLDIPVFHDDQHGTAVVVLAGLYNALRITDKKISDIKVVLNGFGAGGVACARILLAAGVNDIIACDRAGIVYEGRPDNMNPVKEELAKQTNKQKMKGSIADAMRGADVFLGVSQPKAITREMVVSMNRDPIVFALANPVPEIMPEEIDGVARIIATGRSDYANQVNNVLCFPGIFRGALDSRVRFITDEMKLAAARAIADAIPRSELHERNIIPSVFQSEIAARVAKAVSASAVGNE